MKKQQKIIINKTLASGSYISKNLSLIYKCKYLLETLHDFIIIFIIQSQIPYVFI